MKGFIYLMGILLITGCGEGTKQETNEDTAAAVQTVTEKIPLKRSEVKPDAVATHSEKIANPLNDWKFAVNIFETENTFRYLMKIEYEEMRAQDTLKIPNFGIEPKVEIRKGDEPQTCIVGFIDKENKFREYKKVSAKNNNLKITTLKRYAVYEK